MLSLSETWNQKGKFPPGIKPRLGEVAIKAIRLNEYDEHFFNLMPVLFPYNKFTMSVSCTHKYFCCSLNSPIQKLIKRMIFDDHVKILQERIEELLVELHTVAHEGFPKAEEEWQKNVQAWGRHLTHFHAIHG